MGDPLMECIDVGWGAEPGLAPGLFAEGLGQPLFQLLDPGVEPDGAFVCGKQIRLQRGSCDCRAGVLIGAWICLQRMNFLQQVAVPVEECAVDSGFSELRISLRPCGFRVLCVWQAEVDGGVG
jgi:hypothetical protein